MPRPRAVLTLALLGALVGGLAALPAQAQWKWRDKSGQTQYSDLAPPAGTPEADILQRPNSGPGEVVHQYRTGASIGCLRRLPEGRVYGVMPAWMRAGAIWMALGASTGIPTASRAL